MEVRMPELSQWFEMREKLVELYELYEADPSLTLGGHYEKAVELSQPLLKWMRPEIAGPQVLVMAGQAFLPIHGDTLLAPVTTIDLGPDAKRSYEIERRRQIRELQAMSK
jgi:hypothetical protein